MATSIVQFRIDDDLKNQATELYDRLGIDTEYETILDLSVPALTIPVKPGRNLAVIIEIAAMNNRQKKMGYNTAEEFNKRLMEFTSRQ